MNLVQKYSSINDEGHVCTVHVPANKHEIKIDLASFSN